MVKLVGVVVLTVLSVMHTQRREYIYTLFIKKLQAIYLMLYQRDKTAKIKKYKHEHVLAYTFNLSSVARPEKNV